MVDSSGAAVEESIATTSGIRFSLISSKKVRTISSPVGKGTSLSLSDLGEVVGEAEGGSAGVITFLAEKVQPKRKQEFARKARRIIFFFIRLMIS